MSPRIPRRRSGSVNRRWVLRIVVVGVLAFLIGYAVTWALFLPDSDRPQVVTVPDLRAMTPDAARRELGRAGLELEVGDSLPNAEVEAGQILTQSPLPGREVPPGADVRVILSTGAPQRPVPVVSSLTREQAVRLLDAHGFQVEVQEVPDLQPQGRVVGVDPAAGTPVRLPGLVRLRVSTGPPMVAVPELVGLPPDEARAALEERGLRLGEVDYIFAGLDAQELVRSQDPQPGDSIRQGEAVRLWVASTRLPGTIIPQRDPGTEEVHEQEE